MTQGKGDKKGIQRKNRRKEKTVCREWLPNQHKQRNNAELNIEKNPTTQQKCNIKNYNK